MKANAARILEGRKFSPRAVDVVEKGDGHHDKQHTDAARCSRSIQNRRRRAPSHLPKDNTSGAHHPEQAVAAG
jgi:hypothetical protein